ncbi:MAG: DUF1360 domain-containing protein [Myxococcales bacterium]
MQRGAASLFEIFTLGAVVMGLAHTIARERIFLPLRTKLGGKETWLGYLVSCPFCVSWWLSMLLLLVTGHRFIFMVNDLGVVGSVLSWFFSAVLLVVVAAFLRVGFYFVDESQGLVRRRQKSVEVETTLQAREIESDDEARVH